MSWKLSISALADPWSDELIDLESLNAPATDAIVQAATDLRKRASEGKAGVPLPALVAVGPAGVGKTHLFGRLRRKLGPRAMLVHVRPLAGAAMTPRFLLQEILRQLDFDSFGHKQIDLLAGITLGRANHFGAKYPEASLEWLRAQPAADRRDAIEHTVAWLVGEHRNLLDHYLERLIAVPFEAPLVRMAILNWLGGREPNEAQSARIGIREALPDGDVLQALRTLAVVAAPCAPLVIAFDQLENLIDPNDGNSRVTAYANLVSDLVDVVQDVVVVQFGLSSEWERHVVPGLATSHTARVLGRRLPVALPTPEQRRQLLELWCARIAQSDAPFPWPFTGAQLTAACEEVGGTPRMLMHALQRALEGEPPQADSPPPEDVQAGTDQAIASKWASLLTVARKRLDEEAARGLGLNPALLADGLLALSTEAPALGPATVEKEGVRFKQLLLALVLESQPLSVGAALKRLKAAKGSVLAVRERWREFPPTWKATQQHARDLSARPGAAWHWLERDDAARLLALADLLKDARSADVPGLDGRAVEAARVSQWVRESLKPGDWGIARAIAGERSEVAALPPAQAASPESPTGGRSAIEVLRALRVASLERVVRELSRTGAKVTRAQVRTELDREKGVRWVGDAIVCWPEP
jgi:hypothetical protein